MAIFEVAFLWGEITEKSFTALLCDVPVRNLPYPCPGPHTS